MSTKQWSLNITPDKVYKILDSQGREVATLKPNPKSWKNTEVRSNAVLIKMIPEYEEFFQNTLFKIQETIVDHNNHGDIPEDVFNLLYDIQRQLIHLRSNKVVFEKNVKLYD